MYTDFNGDKKSDGYKDGFEALKTLALKHNLINNEGDSSLNYDDIIYLENTCGLRIKVGGYNGEPVTLSSLGISEIKISSDTNNTIVENADGSNVNLVRNAGATFVIDGIELKYADLINILQ